MKKYLFLLAVTFSLLSFSQKAEQVKGNFVHAVYFWLNNPYNETERAAFEASLKKFVNASGFITAYHIGKPASTRRDIVDHTYTYSLVVTFENKALHDAYQIEVAHDIFRAEATPLLKKVQIYDSETF